MQGTSMSFSTHCRAKTQVLLLLVLHGCFAGLVHANPNANANANTGASVATSGLTSSTDTTNASHPLLPGSRMQGEAAFRFWGMRIYHARLWTLPSSSTRQATEQPLVLDLEYQRDLKGQDIAERSLKEMQRAANLSPEKAQRWLSEMQRIFPDIKAGDRLTGLNQPGQAAVFWHNGRPTGQVDDAEFARLFFGIWLSPSTSEPDLRLALLGLTPSNKR